MSELLLVNGKFHTQDPAQSAASAVLVRDGRYAALGEAEDLRPLADLAVIDRDIFSIEPMELFKARSVQTIFAGQVVYQA